MFGFLRPRLTYANVVVTLALFAALGGAAYGLGGGSATTTTITACYKRTSGALRVIKASSRCPRGYGRLTWNRLGRAGPAGATGATGAVGAAGTNGAPGQNGAGVGGSEGWHEVGTAGEPAFAGGMTCGVHPCFWTNDSASAFGIDTTDPNTTAFYKDPLGVVHLKGVACVEDLFTSDCTSGPSYTRFDGLRIFTLPAGDRPAHILNFPALGNNGGTGFSGWVTVRPDGSVRVNEPNNAEWVALDGLTFRAAG